VHISVHVISIFPYSFSALAGQKLILKSSQLFSIRDGKKKYSLYWEKAFYFEVTKIIKNMSQQKVNFKKELDDGISEYYDIHQRDVQVDSTTRMF